MSIVKLIKRGDVEGLEELLSASPMLVNECTNKKADITPLMIAIDEGELECVDVLLRAKAEVNCVDRKSKRTPLLLAALNAYDSLMVRLLELKADPDAVDDSGDAVIHHAIRNNMSTALFVLARRVTKQEALTRDGETPLMLAVANGSDEIVKTLVEKGKFNVNTVDRNGESVVHHAARAGDMDMVELLCRRGGKMTLQNQDGATPVHLVYECYGAVAGDAMVARLPPTQLDLTLRDLQGRTAAESVKLAAAAAAAADNDTSDAMATNTSSSASKSSRKKATTVAAAAAVVADGDLAVFLRVNSLEHLNEAFARKKLTLDDLVDVVELRKLKRLNIGTHDDHHAIQRGVAQVLEQRAADDIAAVAAAEFDAIDAQRGRDKLRVMICAGIVAAVAVLYVMLQSYEGEGEEK